MAVDINLLKRAFTPISQKRRVKKILAIVSLSAVSLFALASLLLFLTNISLAAARERANRRVETETLHIATFSELEIMERTIVDKLIALEKVAQSEKPLDTHIGNVLAIVPADVTPISLSVTGSSFSLQVQSQRLSPLNELINSLIEKDFTKIILEGLRVDQKGVYNLDLSGAFHE